jgi:hypothetical protein
VPVLADKPNVRDEPAEPESKTVAENVESLELQPSTVIPEHKLTAIWNLLESTLPMPSVLAWVLSKEEYQKIFDNYIIGLAKQRGLSESKIEELRGEKAFFVQMEQTEYQILILSSEPKAEEESLTRELVRVAWRYWGNYDQGDWEEYVD